MNLSPEWVPFLINHGHEAAHWSHVGSANSTDEEILAWAVSSSAVVFTSDLDFGAILAASGKVTPSVLQVRHQNPDPLVIGKQVALAISQLESELLAGALVSVEVNKNRARLLPLRP